jgi:hypothetical protein
MLIARILLFCLLAATTCVARDIKLRLLNGETGAPIAGKQVKLSFADKAPPQGSWTGPTLKAKTGPDGVATFHVPNKLPKVLFFNVPLSRVACSSPTFYTDAVLESGVVAKNTCDPKGRLKGKVSVGPGEAVIFERPYKFWERLSQ